jgi:Retinal pigment epithelial membrane protein
LYKEYDYWVTPELISGTVPTDLEGSLFRNGPGATELFGQRINQPFDGEGPRLSTLPFQWFALAPVKAGRSDGRKSSMQAGEQRALGAVLELVR